MILQGLADWKKIRAVKEAVSIPVFANGNILTYSDIERCLRETGADGVMSAEANLANPALFSPPLSLESELSPSRWTFPTKLGLQPPHTSLALEYLDIVKSIATPTSPSAIKGHLFKLLRPALSRETDLRERLGRARIEKGKERQGWEKYEDIIRELEFRMRKDAEAVEGKRIEELVVVNPDTGLEVLPHWLAQPYVRPAPPPNIKQPEVAKEQPGKRLPAERTPEPESPQKRLKLSADVAPVA